MGGVFSYNFFVKVVYIFWLLFIVDVFVLYGLGIKDLGYLVVLCCLMRLGCYTDCVFCCMFL